MSAKRNICGLERKRNNAKAPRIRKNGVNIENPYEVDTKRKRRNAINEKTMSFRSFFKMEDFFCRVTVLRVDID